MPVPVTRFRRAIIAVLAAAFVAVLTSCSGGATPSASVSDGAGSSVVPTLYGSVSVPAGVERIVALSFPEATALVDLGVKPVGRSTYEPDFPAYNTAFADVPDVTDSAGNPDLEKIAALKPDLILADAFATDVEKFRSTYDKLTSIAPTVVLEWTQAAGNWPEEAAGTAAAIGMSDELDALKTSYEQKAAGIRSTYADVLSSHTVDLISGDSSSWYLYGAVSSHGRVFTDAGAALGAAAGQKDGFVEYSPEKIDTLQNTDMLFLPGDSLAALDTIPTFSGLTAVQKGNVFTTGHFFPSSYGIADALLDDFAAALQKAR